MRIAVVSDSHGRIPPELFEALQGAERILHLGDLGPVELLYELGAIAPVTAVQGNNDPAGQPELPPRAFFQECGLNFHLRHHPWTSADWLQAEAPALFLHGHTHRPAIGTVNSGYMLCPGSLRLPRGGFPPAYAWLVLERGQLRMSVRALPDRGLIEERHWTFMPLGRLP